MFFLREVLLSMRPEDAQRDLVAVDSKSNHGHAETASQGPGADNVPGEAQHPAPALPATVPPAAVAEAAQPGEVVPESAGDPKRIIQAPRCVGDWVVLHVPGGTLRFNKKLGRP